MCSNPGFSLRCDGFWASVCPPAGTCCARWMCPTGAACYTWMTELSLRPWRLRWPAHTGTTERLCAVSDSAVRTLHQTIKAFSWTVTRSEWCTAFIVSWRKEATNGSVKGAVTRQRISEYPWISKHTNNCTIIKVGAEVITHKKQFTDDDINLHRLIFFFFSEIS